jgi:hypothetical protein
VKRFQRYIIKVYDVDGDDIGQDSVIVPFCHFLQIFPTPVEQGTFAHIVQVFKLYLYIDLLSLVGQGPYIKYTFSQGYGYRV